MGSHSEFFQRYAFISLGANLDSAFGSPSESICYALTLIAEFSEDPLLISSLLETEPFDCPPGSPNFINAVAGLIPNPIETPLSLLKRLQSIENKVGRTRSGLLNEARVLDLDLITFKNESCATAELTLPHPRACQRKFVLELLREIIGNAIFPDSPISIDDLLSRL